MFIAWNCYILNALAATLIVSVTLNKCHKLGAHRTEPMVVLVRRWLPNILTNVIGDGTVRAIELDLICVILLVRLIALLQ